MDTLQAMFHQFMDEYASELLLARKEDNFKRPFGALVRQSIPGLLKEHLDSDTYLVKGSVGAGRWTDVPWIAVFDKRITQSAQKGVYIVYLLNKDSKTLFLTLNQGATDVAQGGGSDEKKLAFTGIASSSGTKTTTALGEKAELLRKQLSIPAGATYESIKTGSIAYDAGCVFSKSYTVDTLPDDQALLSDLHEFVEAYKAYFNTVFSQKIDNHADNKMNIWGPTEKEYSPGITKEQWIELLNKPDIIGPIWGGALAMFFTEKEGATCTELGKKFGRSPTSISGNCTQLAKRIQKETECPVLEKNGTKSYWPILFLGKGAEKEVQGSFVWKLRPELYDALSEFGIEKYLPEIVKTGIFDSWEIVDADTARKTCDKSFFEQNGSGVPKEICWFFNAEQLERGETIAITLQYEGKEYTGRVSNESSDRRRVRIFWKADLGKMFALKRERKQIKATFIRIGENAYSITLGEEGDVPVSIKNTIQSIKEDIAAEGFSYEDGLIENFYLSLNSKPFVILAGTSGTGKTRLVKLFASAIGATVGNGRYKMVSVRPDWSDSTDLFGHVDLNGRFIPGAIIDFVKRAELDIEHPYILCMDEMNLARVEYYLSDILSVIETREFDASGNIVTDPLIHTEYYGSDADAADKYGTVRLPENLYIVGTVNMDETTFPFSKKVLDRANTIEFSHVDLAFPSFSEEDSVQLSLSNDFLKTKYLLLKQCIDESDVASQYCAELQEINKILASANAHVGYRVRDEVVFYLLNNHVHGLLPEDVAMDNEIMQKILPRIQGSSVSVKNMLCELFKRCAGDFDGYGTSAEDLSKKMFAVAEKQGCKYRKSAHKIADMVRRFEEDGFTSYWL